MQRSIPRYVTVLNEMETHNILETQRLERLETALRNNQTLTSNEKEQIEHLKNDNEELRLTKRKAIYLKKGILMAKAKLVELQNEERYNHLVASKFSRIEALPDSDDEIDTIQESAVSKAAVENDSKNGISTSTEGQKDFKSEVLASIKSPKESKGESSASTDNLKEPKEETRKGLENKTDPKVDTIVYSKNPREHCVSECRVARALQNDGLPLSVRIPLPVKDNEQCVLMGVKDIDKLLEETRLSGERSRNSCSFLQLPKCASVSCLSPPPHPPINSPKSRKSDQLLGNTPHLNQYDSAMNPSQASTSNEKSTIDDGDTKDRRGRKCYKLTAMYRIKTSKEIQELDSTEKLPTIKKVPHLKCMYV